MDYAEDSLRQFAWQGFTVRSIMIDNEPWFVAHDVTRVLRFSNGPKAVGDHVLPGQTSTITIRDGNPGYPVRTIISEAGLYRLIMRSNVPGALEFQAWVTEVVLPSIRRTGTFTVQTPDLGTREGQLALTRMHREMAERLEQTQIELWAAQDAQTVAERALAVAAPQAEAFKDFLESDGSSLISNVARVLKAKWPSGKPLGPNQIFGVLAQRKIIFKRDRAWVPVQKHLQAGHFIVRARTYIAPDGTVHSGRPTTYATPRGQVFIRDLLLSQGFTVPRMTSVGDDLEAYSGPEIVGG